MAAMVSLHDASGAQVGDLEIKSFNKDVVPLSAVTKSVFFRAVFNNLAQNTASTKTRGEVSCSKKKPWRQKGTGRARVGAASSPLWRSGGILFGPRPGGRTLCVNRKVSKQVWQSVFADFLSRGSVLGLDLTENFGVSTSKARKLLDVISKNSTKPAKTFTLLVSPTPESLQLSKSFRNLENVTLEFYNRKDIRSFEKSDIVLFLKNDSTLFEEMVAHHEIN